MSKNKSKSNQLCVEHKFNIGDKVVVPDFPEGGHYAVGTVSAITVKFYNRENDYRLEYTLDEGRFRCYTFYETRLESIDEFNERLKEDRMDYKSYIDWLNKQNFVEGAED